MTSHATRLLLVCLVLAACAALTVSGASADVSQTPVATGCPTGFERLSVARMESIGPYYLPRLVDTGGNDNGYVCGNAQPDSVRDAFCRQGGTVACELRQLGLPHYVFKDDDSPAHRAGAA
jgi:predicted small secreted protein